MVSIKHYDHLAIGVRSLEQAIPFFRDVLGGQYLKGSDHPRDGYRWVQFVYPTGAKVELLEPMGENSFMERFLEQRGEGVHHITFKIHNIREAVARLQAEGYEIVKTDFSDPHWMEAFIHPRSAHGVLIQLAETIGDEEEDGDGKVTVDDILKSSPIGQ